MINWFEIFADKLTALEEGQKEIRSLLTNHTSNSEAGLYGDFSWLVSTCSGIPASTLRIKSATGEIPGVIKLGKRVLYEKAVVLEWLRSQARPVPTAVVLEQAADEQFANQLAKKGGRETV